MAVKFCEINFDMAKLRLLPLPSFLSNIVRLRTSISVCAVCFIPLTATSVAYFLLITTPYLGYSHRIYTFNVIVQSMLTKFKSCL